MCFVAFHSRTLKNVAHVQMSEFSHLSDENGIRMDHRDFGYYMYHSPHFTRRTIKRRRAAPEWVPDPYDAAYSTAVATHERGARGVVARGRAKP